ncbi:MAG: HEAT repeat domain-containing protein [Planctomycetes bacterium]|nr:HEAT repeat domain-containing protein [Planctomycetota bacterium]
MNRTLLVLIGIACALVTAAGIMYKHNPIHEKKSIPQMKKLLYDLLTDKTREHSGGSFYADEHHLMDNLLKSGVTEEESNTIYKKAFKPLGLPAESQRSPAPSGKEETEKDKESKTEVIDFTGTVTEIDTWNSPRRSLQDWFIRIKIKELTTNTQTIQPGKEIIYYVHSPVQFFHEPREQAVGKDYKFRARCLRNEKGEVTIPGLKVMDEILKQRPLLHDKDASVRREAIDFLSSYEGRDEESIPEIRKLLNDDSDMVRRSALASLTILRDKESIPTIRKFLDDSSERMRIDATQALVMFNDKESIPKIKEMLTDKSESVRKNAAEALEHFDRLEKHIQKDKEKK